MAFRMTFGTFSNDEAFILDKCSTNVGLLVKLIPTAVLPHLRDSDDLLALCLWSMPLSLFSYLKWKRSNRGKQQPQ